MADVLSKRADRTLNIPEFLVHYLLEVSANSFHPADNPSGIVNLGTIENKTCEDIWLKKVEDLTPLIADKSSLYYYNLSGFETGISLLIQPCGLDNSEVVGLISEVKFNTRQFFETLKLVENAIWLRQNIGKFLGTKLKLPEPLDPQKIVLLDGVTAVLNAVALAIADEGDAILCPIPTYGRILNDIEEVAGARFYKVPMFQECDTGDAAEFRIDVIEKYYEKAVNEGRNVKGLILCNPQNPTGKVYSQNDISCLLDFCARKGIHIVVDEIYALSCYDKPEFISVLQCNIPDPARTHFLWGFSKDLSLSGFRCGMIYSESTRLIDYIRKVSFFCSVPAPVQIILNAIISDSEWLDTVYFPTYQKRMRENFEIACRGLEAIGVPFYRGTAGSYIWMDLTKFLPSKTNEEELALFHKLLLGGVYLCPGKEMFSPYAGWFRFTFTTYKDHVIEGLKRMEKVLTSN